MKLLLTLTYYYPHWTGLTTHAVRIAEGLAARGVDVTVLTVRHLPTLPDDEIINGVRVVRLRPVSRFSRGMITPALPYAAAKLIAEHDVVQIHTPMPEGPIIAAWARLLRKPLLMTHHGDLVFPPGLFNQLMQNFGYYVLLFTGKLANHVTSYSRDYAENSRLLLNFRDKIDYVFPPVEIPAPDLQAAAKWKRDLGLEGKTILGFAGRWVEEKGFDYLLRAFPLIQKQIPNAHLVYAGEPRVAYDDFYRECLPYIEPIREHLSLVGLILNPQQMANFYAMCDLFVQPSRTDMLGLVQVEAMLCGVPVVVSNIPGARVAVQETGFGKLAPPGDPQKLAGTILDVFANYERFRPSRAAVLKQFNADKTLDSYQRLLEGLVAQYERTPIEIKE